MHTSTHYYVTGGPGGRPPVVGRRPTKKTTQRIGRLKACRCFYLARGPGPPWKGPRASVPEGTSGKLILHLQGIRALPQGEPY